MTWWWTALALPAALTHFALWALLLIFGVKTYRSCKLESLPWLGIYIVASIGVEVVWSAPGLSDSTYMDQGFTFPLQALAGFMSGSARLALAILLLADFLFLLSRAGTSIEGALEERLVKVRERSATWGIIMLLLMLAKAGLGVILFLQFP
jgi:hypothetical protein